MLPKSTSTVKKRTQKHARSRSEKLSEYLGSSSFASAFLFVPVGSNGIARGYLLIDAAGDHHVPFKRLRFRVPLLILHWPRGRNALQIHQQIAAMRPDKNIESWNSAFLWYRYDGWMVRQGPHRQDCLLSAVPLHFGAGQMC